MPSSSKSLSVLTCLQRGIAAYFHRCCSIVGDRGHRGLHVTSITCHPLGVVQHLKDEEALPLPTGARRSFWEVLEFRSDGTVIETWKTPEVLNLHPRDSHMFSNVSYAGSKSRAMITPRSGTILFRTEAARACIFSDRAVLFPCKRLKDTVRTAQAIKTAISHQKVLPFELRVLEALLAETHRSLDVKAKRLAMVADTVITDVSRGAPATSSELQRFLPINRKLVETQYDVKDTLEAINDAMEDEQQLFRMCLRERAKILSLRSQSKRGQDDTKREKSAAEKAGNRRENDLDGPQYKLEKSSGKNNNHTNAADASSASARDHLTKDKALEEESDGEIPIPTRSVEIRMASHILEAYEYRLLAVQDSLNECIESLETTRHVWNMSLDHNRNRILRINLLISIASFAGLISTMPAAFFGMNLVSGVEEIPGLFWPVIEGSVASGTFAAAAIYGYYKFGPKRRYTARMRDMRSLRDLLTFHLDDIDAIMDAVRHRNALNKKEFAGAVREAVPSISSEEIDLLFRVFDQNKDAIIELSEIMRIEELHGRLQESFLEHHTS